MHATIDTSTIAESLKTVSALVDECKIRLEADGLGIRAVDPANVGMVDTYLDTDAFERYDVSAEDGVIGVNLNRLEDVVGMADAGQLVEFDLNEETRKLHIQIDGLEYTLALIDPSSVRQEPDIPDLDLPARVVVEGRDITRAVKAADMVSDHIRFVVDEEAEGFRVKAAGDTDAVDFFLGRDEVIDLTLGAANSLFSLDYLGDMATAIPADGEVTLELGEEIPVKLHFELAEGNADVTYMLAPRIDSNGGGR